MTLRLVSSARRIFSASRGFIARRIPCRGLRAAQRALRRTTSPAFLAFSMGIDVAVDPHRECAHGGKKSGSDDALNVIASLRPLRLRRPLRQIHCAQRALLIALSFPRKRGIADGFSATVRHRRNRLRTSATSADPCSRGSPCSMGLRGAASPIQRAAADGRRRILRGARRRRCGRSRAVADAAAHADSILAQWLRIKAAHRQILRNRGLRIRTWLSDQLTSWFALKPGCVVHRFLMSAQNDDFSIETDYPL